MDSSRITGINADTYYNYAIIKGRSKPDNKLVRLVVDSRERNHMLFKNPNEYEVTLDEPIANVTFAKLISSSIPFAGYMVNTHNNVIHFGAAGSASPTAVKVPVGDYEDGEALAAAVQEAMGGAGEFTVEDHARTDNFTFKGAAPFSLEFQGPTIFRGNNPDHAFPRGSMAAMLGFGAKNYISSLDPASGESVVASEFRKNFDVDDAVVLHVDLMELNRSTMDVVDGSFAILHKAEGYSTRYSTTTYDDFFFCKYFYPSIRLSKIKVRFTDTHGNPYDFQNQDHRLEFLVETNIKNVH